MKNLILFVAFMICWQSHQVNSQEGIDQLLIDAYVSNDVGKWKKVIKDLESNSSESYKLAEAYYGLAGHFFSKEDLESASEALDKGFYLLKDLIKNDREHADANALFGAFYSMYIGISPIKAIYYSSRSSKYISKALKIENDNPIGLAKTASNSYFTPEKYGGSIPRAIAEFKSAIAAFEIKNRSNEWLYLDTLAWLGNAYMKNNEKQKAIDVYQLALEKNPNYGWVKHVLLPKAQKS